MIDSLTIISKGGLILFQHYTEEQDAKAETTNAKINAFLAQTYLDPTFSSQQQRRLVLEKEATVVEWQESSDLIAIVLYPQVVLLRGSATTTAWLQPLLTSVLREFSLFMEKTQTESTPVPDTSLFDKTFSIVLKQAIANKENAADETIVPLSKQQPLQRAATAKSTTGGKEKRTWGEAKVTDAAMAQLDFSKDTTTTPGMDRVESSNALAEARAAYLPSDTEVPLWEEQDMLQDDEEASSSSSWGSSLRGMFDHISGNKVLTEADLQGPMDEMQKLLESKNVASDIAQEICTSVKTQLVGRKMASFARTKTAVRQGLEAAITKILTPPRGRQVDILRGVLAKRSSSGSIFSSSSSSKGPYAIVMIGINGVGKSTSLAKIAYYLKQNDCSPMLAACDTFRSGAVEQLNVHAKCLDVPLYHKGYAKDPSAVATAAIEEATQLGHDTVLVDTAGRMQNNVPLMKALSKLVVENKPDLVLFVCEALVGNDGMDQLNMFNQALKTGGHDRQIDGIILTKWDTVSEKVGAALTLTHVSGAPVVFCGTGQKYNHLKRLNAAGVIKSLFS